MVIWRSPHDHALSRRLRLSWLSQPRHKFVLVATSLQRPGTGERDMGRGWGGDGDRTGTGARALGADEGGTRGRERALAGRVRLFLGILLARRRTPRRWRRPAPGERTGRGRRPPARWPLGVPRRSGPRRRARTAA